MNGAVFGVPVGAAAGVVPGDDVLFQSFPHLGLEVEPEVLGQPLLDAADQEGGGFGGLDVDGLVTGEDGHVRAAQLAFQFQGVEVVAPGPLDVLADHRDEPRPPARDLPAQVGHAPSRGMPAADFRSFCAGWWIGLAAVPRS